jgi:hypothetical protein
MWDDAIIGTGHKGVSAVRVLDIEGDHSISQNSVSYWIGDLYLNTGIVIFKDTPEGRELAGFVKDKVHIDKIKPLLDSLVLQHINKDHLKGLIDQALAKAFEEGSRDRADRIRSALGV